MIPINEEVAIKQEILEVSLNSLSGPSPTLNSGGSGKKRKRAGPEKRIAAAKAPGKARKTAPKPDAPSSQPRVLSNKLTILQKEALRSVFTGHTSVPSLTSRNAWASANNLKGEAVHRYCRYLRDKSKQNLVKQEPGTEPQVEAEWHLNIVNVVDEREAQVEQSEAPASVLQTGISESESCRPDFPANPTPSMAAPVLAPSPSSTPYPTTLLFALESLQMSDFSFLADTRFFDLLTGPEAIIYDDLHDPITFCMKFQDSLCSLDMEVAHEALRTMYFFDGDIAGKLL